MLKSKEIRKIKLVLNARKNRLFRYANKKVIANNDSFFIALQ